MLRLGIIGTNWITDQFVQAALETKRYVCIGVYSRRLATAQAFGEKYGATLFEDDLTRFFASEELDVIYIASPNSLHFTQAKQAIEHGKHVIVEKPAVANEREWDELVTLAEQHGVKMFEAARHIHEENFKKVAELIHEMDEIVAANFSFMKYSSRFDDVRAGQEPNIFSPHFSGGALMDLGVYLIYAAVSWFGEPEEAYYFANKLATGVDGTGHIILRYPTFDVNLMTGKVGHSELPSEIIGYDQTIRLNATNSIEKIERYDRTSGEYETIPVTKETNPMVEEANAFADVMTHLDDETIQAAYRKWLVLGQQVHRLMYQLRQQADLKFDVDSLSNE